jgi:NADPH-dependent glutamate synthase beta subunit-like oxidoreductase
VDDRWPSASSALRGGSARLGPIAARSDPKLADKIAVVGAGPTGLSCAYFLVRDGYPVTVFEARAVLGGKLRAGIPGYRLPAEALDQDIALIRRLGVTFVTDHPIGNTHGLEDLSPKGTGPYSLPRA